MLIVKRNLSNALSRIPRVYLERSATKRLFTRMERHTDSRYHDISPLALTMRLRIMFPALVSAQCCLRAVKQLWYFELSPFNI